MKSSACRTLRAVESPGLAEIRTLSAPLRLLGSMWKLGVFCNRGPLRVGDLLIDATGPEGATRPIRLEVVQIDFFGCMIDALDPIFSANLIVSGDPGPVGKDWTLRTCVPAESVRPA